MEEPQPLDETKHSVEAPSKEQETRKLTGIKVKHLSRSNLAPHLLSLTIITVVSIQYQHLDWHLSVCFRQHHCCEYPARMIPYALLRGQIALQC